MYLEIKKNKHQYFFYYNKIGKIIECKILKIRLRNNFIINSITIQFPNRGRFVIIKDNDKKRFFELNKKVLHSGTFGSKYSGIEINIEKI